jgi:hypothetical protein
MMDKTPLNGAASRLLYGYSIRTRIPLFFQISLKIHRQPRFSVMIRLHQTCLSFFWVCRMNSAVVRAYDFTPLNNI